MSKFVEYNVSYESGNILRRDYSDLDGLELCIIKDIFVANNIYYFECSQISIVEFNPKYNSCICKERDDLDIFTLAANFNNNFVTMPKCIPSKKMK